MSTPDERPITMLPKTFHPSALLSKNIEEIAALMPITMNDATSVLL